MTTVPAPEGLAYFPYQLEGIRFVLEREGTLLADEMGVGKTIQAIGVINADPTIQKVLIVCPVVMRLVWKRELGHWLSFQRTIGVVGIDRDPADKQIIICNYDRLSTPWLRSKLGRHQWDLAILDESHFCKSLDARRTRLATSIQAERRLALSGTPLLNHPTELLPILTWLDPATWPKKKWFDFGQRYGGAVFNGFGWQYTGATNLDELSAKLRSSVMIRRTKSEVLPDLPAKRRTVIELEPDDDIAQLVRAELVAFERFEAAAQQEEAGDTRDNGYRNAIKKLKPVWKKEWDNLAIVRHQTAIAKVPYVVEFVSEALTAGNSKIVLWCHHRAVANELLKGLVSYNPVLMLGGMLPLERQRAIDTFQTDPASRVFIGGITAAGIGITLTAASHCVFAELSWVPAEISQAEDRLHRIGAKDNVLVQHLVMSGSLDAIMARRLLAKQKTLDAVLG
jgi:SWI/SNF-related matrix-associated actin-dependent regulator 1 of chromatin subfamily A